jgi:cytochrome b involved in lipid metabolism
MSHKKNEKLIIYIDCYMFDVTEYANSHPGGKKILQKYNRKDATKAFNQIKGHCDGYVYGLLDEFCIGKVSDADK